MSSKQPHSKKLKEICSTYPIARNRWYFFNFMLYLIDICRIFCCPIFLPCRDWNIKPSIAVRLFAPFLFTSQRPRLSQRLPKKRRVMAMKYCLYGSKDYMLIRLSIDCSRRSIRSDLGVKKIFFCFVYLVHRATTWLDTTLCCQSSDCATSHPLPTVHAMQFLISWFVLYMHHFITFFQLLSA